MPFAFHCTVRHFVIAFVLLVTRVAFAGAGPTTVVVIGATGDLTSRLLMPSFVQLSEEGELPKGARIVGMALPSKAFSGDDGFRSWMKTRLATMGGNVEPAAWDRLSRNVNFHEGDLADAGSFTALKSKLTALDQADREAGAIGASRRVVFYFAIAPKLIGTTLDNLAKAGLIGKHLANDVVLEKPIGTDSTTAREINDKLESVIGEQHVYRMDHYLGKTTVRNLHHLRFEDPRFKSIWNKKFIERIEVAAVEKLGVEGRGGYYEQAGATSDMVQSHLLQVVAMATMDKPKSQDAADLRKSKIALLKSIKPANMNHLERDVVRGQYTGNDEMPGYLGEQAVSPSSSTETFVAMKLNVGTRAFKNVPINVTTGKALGEKQSYVKVHFKRLPTELAIELGRDPAEHATLTLGIDPTPSLSMDGQKMAFDRGKSPQLSPYANQLRSVLASDPSLFLHRDESEASWAFIDPIRALWAQAGAKGLKKYRAGSTGPAAAQRVTSRAAR